MGRDTVHKHAALSCCYLQMSSASSDGEKKIMFLFHGLQKPEPQCYWVATANFSIREVWSMRVSTSHFQAATLMRESCDTASNPRVKTLDMQTLWHEKIGNSFFSNSGTKATNSSSWKKKIITTYLYMLFELYQRKEFQFQFSLALTPERRSVVTKFFQLS